MAERSADPAARAAHAGRFGEAEVCPHCGNTAPVERSRTLRFRCAICGGPRVTVADPALKRTGRELEALSRVLELRLPLVTWGAVAATGGILGSLGLLVSALVLWLASPGLFGTAGLVALAALPWLLVRTGWRRLKEARAERQQALDDAWSRVAADVLEERGEELTAAELARELRLRETEAEQVLAHAQVHQSVRTHVTDAGELAYSKGVTRRWRVTAPEQADEAASEAEAAAEASATDERTAAHRDD